MIVYKAYKIRLYPTESEAQLMLQIIGNCRYVYNYYLMIQMNAYAQIGTNISFADLSKDLTKLRNDENLPWLNKTHHAPLKDALIKLDRTYQNRFRGSGQPRFKTKHDLKQSFSKADKYRIRDNRLVIQRELRLKFRGTLPPSGAVPKTLTVSVTPTGKWFASIKVQEYMPSPPEHITPIGIDLGLTHLAITSDGEKFDNLRPAKRLARQLKAAQQSLARSQKGSNRRIRAKRRVALLHEKAANQRKHHLHQVSSAITRKNHALIAVEDLAVANLVKSHRLSKSISDVSWGELLRQLEYKQQWRSGEFVKVGRYFPSSKLCSVCRRIKDQMALSERVWTCDNCDTVHDRDTNAARNILKQAEVLLSVESTEGSRKVRVTGSVKRKHAMA